MSFTPVYLYNTESRQKQLLRTVEAGHVKMYTCGPTVYNFAHIGNFRAYLFEDLLRRTLKYFGYRVTQVMNLTDVDDKTIRGAIAQKVSLKDYTQPYINAFFEDLKTLRIEKAEKYPAATDYIPHMIAMIEKLLAKGMAYQGSDKSIYFPIKKFGRYGCLSHLNLDDLQSGASNRVSNDEYDKDHVADFVLWKAYDSTRDGDIFWESPFGLGRPGWHLECSTMAMELLGETLDIHCGGIDNMFPHHENEIAQSEACSGHHFVNLWMHCEHLVVDNKKMSKSLGNFFTLRDLLAKGFSGREIRFMLLQTHYKTQLNFTLPGLEGARSSIHRLNAFIRRLQEVKNKGAAKQGTQDRFEELIEKAKHQFDQALADDLNISVALAALFDLVREGNLSCDDETMSSQSAQKALDLFAEANTILDVLDDLNTSESVPQDLLDLLEERKKAREAKNWTRSDEIRAEIAHRGYQIDDTSLGARLVKKEGNQ